MPLASYTGNMNGEIHTRQRMRPWLEARINSREIPGLEWLDPLKKIFKVPWKHVGNREWREDDSQIFREWAIHTGKYREGVDSPDWPTWKTRFRCALTKLPDIKELKERANLEGHAEPYRVYQFLPRQDQSTTTNDNHNENVAQITTHQTQPMITTAMPTIPTQAMTQQSSHFSRPAHDVVDGYPGASAYGGYDCVDGTDRHFQEPNHGIPATVTSNFSSGGIASDLDGIKSDDLIICTSKEIKEEYMDFEENNSQSSDLKVCQGACRDIAVKAEKSYPGGEKYTSEVLSQLEQMTGDFQVLLTIRYRQNTVMEKYVSNREGCRMFYSDGPYSFTYSDPLLGTQPLPYEPVLLPSCDSGSHSQDKLTRTLLGAMERGVILYMVSGNLVALRLCKCAVFMSSPSINNGEMVKLVRERPTVIYDYQSYFKAAAELYIHGKGPKPSTEVTLSFGQRFDLKKEPVTNLLISVTIFHVQATVLMTKILCTSPLSPPIEMSKSDSYDKFLAQMKNQHPHNQGYP